MSKKHSITYPWFDSQLMPNRAVSQHWASIGKKKKFQRQIGYLLTKNEPKPYNYYIDIYFNEPSKHRRDMQNMFSAIKALLDGVADAWGVDDYLFNPRIIRGKIVKNGSIIIEYDIE